MVKEDLIDIRKHLVNKLMYYEGQPVKLDLPSDILDEILFDYIEGHKNFAKELRNLGSGIIRKLDFTGVSFKDFDCEGKNFSILTGVVINPQEVYKKSLAHAKLSGVLLDLDYYGFDGANLLGTNFKGAKTKYGNIVTIDPQRLGSKKLTNCKFDGVRFVGSFDECNIEGADFTGSIDAVIDPQTLDKKSVKGATLFGVKFRNSFMDVDIERANFTCSTYAVINPQTVKNKSLSYTILTSTYVVGPFYECNIEGADFTGAGGNIFINPQTVLNKNLKNCKLTGVKIMSSTIGCDTEGTNFAGSIIAFPYSAEITEEKEDLDKEKIKKIITRSIRI